ncbi:hypothetical protein HOD30_00240 [Candidatus Peregrinibacteria bacterium]|jgi:hypothetical protein|nr:hypothetical protein [Candidatus Peregrinibacteria bacterium]MBT4631356.1 hypothetical protein [Candidatus Peregrinibacteria bacterium]MBT5517187.1 hypothetical protein [Candidatus Peregrinibacteria bacterium]MBT5823769.1 hypothetical protein [Candidatus Peregrinibacteria bacterium]
MKKFSSRGRTSSPLSEQELANHRSRQGETLPMTINGDVDLEELHGGKDAVPTTPEIVRTSKLPTKTVKNPDGTTTEVVDWKKVK